jgi:hypothetical protein
VGGNFSLRLLQPVCSLEEGKGQAHIAFLSSHIKQEFERISWDWGKYREFRCLGIRDLESDSVAFYYLSLQASNLRKVNLII